MRRFLHIFIYVAMLSMPVWAQRPDATKLSPWLRQLAREEARKPACLSSSSGSTSTTSLSRDSRNARNAREVISFIRLTPDGEGVLDDNGCRSLAAYGTLHIASIPVDRLTPLSHDPRVLRIEARPSNHVLNDSMAIHLNATDVYQGKGLPQAYTGKGVVMGLMDIGFDLTHPNFYTRDASEYRIRHFWDQLSQDTIGSPFPVGRDFTTKDELLALGHSRDGLDLTHGTHTLGIAAGSGYRSPYQGMAPESDICLVANAVVDDLPYIDSLDVYKYTFATDALGFKYIFDYAGSVGKPCVISFSEGSMQDFYGYDQLYYEMLDSLTGPGRILVAAAGNEGATKSYFRKPLGLESTGTFLRSTDTTMMVVLKSSDDFLIRLVSYASHPDTLLIKAREVLTHEDSTATWSLPDCNVLVEAYPSCYDKADICYDVTVTTPRQLGSSPRLSLELMGRQADVELWKVNGLLTTYAENPQLDAGEFTHNIHSPSSAPCVISVGATTYRDHIINMQGDSMSYWGGTGGRLTDFSSVGPTMDGRIKPDCVAPGNNIISSYSSFFMENHPESNDLLWNVDTFPFEGRTYAWTANSGTSSSSPAVGGAIALWLQACPTLSPSDVVNILERTCHHNDPDLSYPNNYYGHGELDVYAGLLEVLRLAEHIDIPRHHTAARISLRPGQLIITLPEVSGQPIPLRLYDLNGRPMLSTTLPASIQDHTVALPPLPAGVYALVIGSGSTLIRINQ